MHAMCCMLMTGSISQTFFPKTSCHSNLCCQIWICLKSAFKWECTLYLGSVVLEIANVEHYNFKTTLACILATCPIFKLYFIHTLSLSYTKFACQYFKLTDQELIFSSLSFSILNLVDYISVKHSTKQIFFLSLFSTTAKSGWLHFKPKIPETYNYFLSVLSTGYSI